MSELKIGLPGGADFLQPELSTTQVPVASGAGSISVTANIATITTAGAHGLTMTPAAGTLPNFFFTLTGVTAQTGVGTFNGPIFRILSIPTTTTFTCYTTITAGTFTAGTVVPVFLPPFTSIVGSTYVGFLNNLGTNVAPALVQSSFISCLLGPNCTIQYNTDNTSVIQDATVASTLAVAPVYRIGVAASTGSIGVWMNPPQTALFASGGAGTSRISVIE
jgi:hypothetical protein